jgi:multidrug efflux system outer membrane protein
MRDFVQTPAGLFLIFVFALGGCAVGPDYRPPRTSENTPPEWKAAPAWKQAEPRDTAIKPAFWEIFDDPVLDELEHEAMTNNPDVQAAFARVQEAAAVARIARSELVPSLSLDPHALRERYSNNRPVPPLSPRPLQGYTASDFLVPFDLSYEVDLWGRVRRSFRGAREQAQAGAADYQNVLLGLQGAVAQTYFVLRAVDLERRELRATVELRRKNLSLTEFLHSGGADSAVDVGRAQTELASAEAGLAGYQLRRQQLENALAALCGQKATSFRLAETMREYSPPVIPVGLPADLLERRPDVAEAERNMAAASEGIGIAKAAYFPTIQLTGAAGTESAQLKNIFDWESRVWTFGPSVNVPLFEGGRIRADVARARAAYAESEARYRSQVLVAFREVEDTLAGLSLLGEQYAAQVRAVDAARKVAELSRNRYKEGLVSYFEVVDAERTELENEILAFDLNGQRMVDTVLLIRALGGGWTADELAIPAGH